jgi:hypothetical protein
VEGGDVRDMEREQGRGAQWLKAITLPLRVTLALLIGHHISSLVSMSLSTPTMPDSMAATDPSRARMSG